MKVSRLFKVLIAGIVVVGLCAFCLGCSSSENSESSSLINGVTSEQEVVYTIYVGLIDKDTGKQEISTEDSKNKLMSLFTQAGSGYTLLEGNGAYVNEEGKMMENITLVCTGIHGEEQAIIDLINEIKQELNLESVYCESNLTGFEIFGGKTSEIK